MLKLNSAKQLNLVKQKVKVVKQNLQIAQNKLKILKLKVAKNNNNNK